MKEPNIPDNHNHPDTADTEILPFDEAACDDVLSEPVV